MRRAALWSALLAALVVPGDGRAAATLELWGNFDTMGIRVELAAGDDPDSSATATAEARASGGTYRPVFPPTRVSPTRFVGSLFDLAAATAMDVRVTLHDGGGPLDGVVLEATGSTRAEPVLGAPERVLSVAPGGTGTACSAASPCALSAALAQVAAGDEVRLAGGVYHVGALSVPASGTAGSPIVIRSAPGERAVLDGADPTVFTWSDAGGGVFSTTVVAPDPHVVLSSGLRLFPYASLSDLTSLTWGVPGFYASGTALYVHLAGGAAPVASEMVVSRFGSGLTLDGRSFVDVVDLEFRHYGQGGDGKAIYVRGSSDVLVRGCTFASNDLGVGLKLTSERVTIEENEAFDAFTGWPWDGVKAVGGLEDGFVYVFDPMDGRGLVVRHNRIHDDFDGSHLCPTTSPGRPLELDFEDNVVFGMGDDGVETDGVCSNVRVLRNDVHDVLMGVSLAPVAEGPVFALRNVIHSVGVGAPAGSGSGFKLNSGGDPSGPIFLAHNTVDAVTPATSAFNVLPPGSWSALWARNNVWSGTDYAISNSNPGQPLDLDHDALWTTAAGELAWWSDLVDRQLNTIEELRSATGLELNGIAVAPGFADAAAGDYRPAEGSPLVDAALLIPGINDVYVGSAPDLGALERGAAPGTTPGTTSPGGCGCAPGGGELGALAFALLAATAGRRARRRSGRP